MQTYTSVSSLEQSIVQLFAVVYQSVTKLQFLTFLSKSGIRSAKNKVFAAKTFNPILHRLVELELIESVEGRYRCHRLLTEEVSKQAVRESRFKTLAQAVQETDSLRDHRNYMYYSPFRSYDQLLREIRIHLYTGHFEKMYEHLDIAREAYPEQFVQFNPLLLIFNNPFDKNYVSTLPKGLLNSVLLYILQHSVATLTPAQEAFELLQERVQESDCPVFLNYLLAEQLILRNRIGDARRLLPAEPDTAIALAIRGWLHFIEADNAAAIRDYTAAHQMLRRVSGIRKIYFSELAGVFYVMALLHEGSDKSLRQALDIVNTVDTLPEHPFPTTYHGLKTLVLLQQGAVQHPARQYSSALKATDLANTDGVLLLLVLYWLDALDPPRLQAIAAELQKITRASGYPWLADELQGMSARLNQDEAAQRPDRHTLIDLIRRKESWEHALDALQNIAGSQTRQRKQVHQSRLVWWLDYYRDGHCSLEPREQKLDKNGNWTKGRPVAFKRLHKNSGKLDFLSEQDLKASTFIRQEYHNYYGNVGYDIDSDHALLALVGHPLLFWADAPKINVELVKGEPELIVEQTGNKQLSIRFAPKISDQRSIYISKETPTRLKIIEIKEAHKRIAGLIGSGLTIPQSARERVLEAVGAVSRIVTIQSSIGGALENLETVTGDTRPHLHLLPFGDGLKCELLVRPFQQKGPYYRPGSGGATVIAEVDGQRLQASRDLEQECQRAQQVVDQIPMLQSLSAIDGEWTLLDPEDCLQTLIELQVLGDSIVVEWPEGEKFRVSRPASLNSFRMNIKRRGDWFDVTGEIRLDEDLVLDLRQLLNLLQDSPGRFVKLEDGQFLALTQEFRRRLDELRRFTEPTAKGARLHPLAALALEEFSSETSETGMLKTDKHWKDHIGRLREAEALQPELPSTLQAELRDYQLAGFQWLARLAHWGVGACLADDMGLGKTLQALALLLTRAQLGPSLVIAPTSVCMNWQAEAHRFAPTLNIVLFGGGDRQQVLDALGPFDLLVCSYGLLQNESEKLAQKPWQVIVLDEAQAIKNMTTKRSQAAMDLQGEFKMITTGTPIENHLGELWNLFRFINPGLLGSLESFNRRFAVPIERDQDAQARYQLKKLIQPFILRRVKSEVLQELPSRTEIVLHVEQGNEERAFYEALRRQALERLQQSDAEGGQKHLQILAQITRLRRACCNPRLILKDESIASAKLEAFGELLEELLANRHKALVFSQFVDHLSILRELLDEQKISYQYLDGSTPAAERKKRVDAFQAGDGDIFLISLKAGGVGLNLTAADYVIHMDPWWNPAVEDQAADRAHRIGQQRPVTIYRLVTRDTIEEKIVDLHHQKRDLASSLLEGSDMSGKLSAEQLLALLWEE